MIKSFDGRLMPAAAEPAAMTDLRSLLRAPSGRLRTPWRLLVAGLLLVAVNLAVAVAFVAWDVPVDPGATDGPRLAVGLLALTVDGVAVAGAVLLAARYLDHRRLGDLGLSVDGAWWRDLGVGAALGVALVGGAYAAGLLLGVYEASFDPAGPAGYPLSVWLALVVATMVAVGVYEELLLRGYLLTNLAEGFAAFLGRRGAVLAALAVSSAAFGLLHGRNPSATTLGLVTIALAGVLLGLGYVATGRIALPVGLHVTWNLTHVLLGVPVSGLRLGVRLVETETTGAQLVHGGAFGPEGGLLGLAATLVGCVGVVAYGRRTGRGLEPSVAVPSLRGERAAQRGSEESVPEDRVSED